MSVSRSVQSMPVSVQALHASALLKRAEILDGFSFADLVFAKIAPKPVVYESALALNALLARPLPPILQPDFASVLQLNDLLASHAVDASDASGAAEASSNVLCDVAHLTRETPANLAARMAVTRQGHVRKGKKKFASVATKAARKPKRAVVAVKKKKAPKRRHVWLSNQTRVVRPVLPSNVVSIARGLKSNARGGTQKLPSRVVRLAA